MNSIKEILSANREIALTEIRKAFRPSNNEELKVAMSLLLSTCEKYEVSLFNKTGKEFSKLLGIMARKAANSNKKPLRELIGAIKEITGDTRSAAEIRMSHN